MSFGGIHALQGAELDVPAGRVSGLIGPNGAGKTTLFNVVTGLQDVTSGRVYLDGEDVTHLRPHLRARRGMGRTFQRLEVFGSLTVRENVLVAGEIRRRWGRDDFDPERQADELLAWVGVSSLAGVRVDALPTGPARLVEIARALATQPRLLLLDEPGSGLNEAETAELSDRLRDLAVEGLGVLVVEHDMEMVMAVCERIAVLDYGRMIAEGTPDDIRHDEAVQAAYLGAVEESDDAA